MNAKFNNKSPRFNPSTLEKASEWQARLWSENVSEQDRQACLSWRNAHPEHERAWQFVNMLDQQLQHLSEQQQNILLDRPLDHLATLIKRGGMLSVILGLGFFIYQQQNIYFWLADYQTKKGEIRHISLSDGTKLILDSNSAVNIDFTQNERNIYLLKGQILIETGHKYNELRAFHVHYSNIEIQPLGTKFTVSNRQHNIQVGVHEGRVQIKSDKISPPVILQSGWQVHFNPDQQKLDYQKNNELRLAWIQHKLIVEQMPFCEFMHHVSEYRVGYIYCDSSLKHLKVSGTYYLNQNDQILAELPHILPIKIQYFSPYMTRITHK